MSNFDKTLEALIQYTYDSGYYSSQNEDGQPHHKEAILQRAYAKAELVTRVKTLVATARDQAQTLLNLSNGFVNAETCEIARNGALALLTAVAPFEETDHGPH